MNTAILLLGTNMGERRQNLIHAIDALRNKVGKVGQCSSVYESEPWGFEADQSFFNQVIEVETLLPPLDLLLELQKIEKNMGRVKTRQTYESRLIDIDILFYDDLVMDREELKIPHPEIKNRRFALEPLHELFPRKVHPVVQKTISQLLKKCMDKLWVKKLPLSK